MFEEGADEAEELFLSAGEVGSTFGDGVGEVGEDVFVDFGGFGRGVEGGA